MLPYYNKIQNYTLPILMPNPYNKSQQDFGKTYEDIFEEEVLTKTIIGFTATDTYNEVDFIGDTDKTLIMIELKTRKHAYGTFDTTIIPCGKVKYYKGFKTDKQKRLFFVFCFLDGDNNHTFYYIKYSNQVFNTFERQDFLQGGQHYKIPMECLKPCDDAFIKLIDNY